ncbi:MAG: hypothetical protein V5A55_02140 [Halovenus sp.]
MNHFANVDDMAGYAASSGTSAPGLAVTFPGCVGPALAVFLLATTPAMHNFWNALAENGKAR